MSDPSTPRKIEDAKNISIYNDVIDFTLFELETITKSFRADYVLGEGGFGTVYKGYIDENVRVGLKSLPVAVKVLNKDGHQGHREWLVSCQLVQYSLWLLMSVMYMDTRNINNYSYKNMIYLNYVNYGKIFVDANYVFHNKSTMAHAAFSYTQVNKYASK